MLLTITMGAVMNFALGAFISAGEIYSLGNWDGTLDLVEVLEASSDDVTFRYPNDIIHKVSRKYFTENILWKSLRRNWDFMIKLYFS